MLGSLQTTHDARRWTADGGRAGGRTARQAPAISSCCLFFLAALLLGGCGGGSPPTDDGPPYEPEAALRTFEIEDGFRIDLVAAEPLVMDPVAMDIDERGRIYVVEMPGYPLDKGGTGRVKLLQDTDGNGMPDAATLFADSLTLPTGIMRWKDGVLVTDAPDVLYLEDTDGDGRADVRRAVLTGFALSNPQANVNKPLYGLDNWIYLANNGPVWWTKAHAEQFGDRGREILFPDRPDAPRLGRNGLDRNVRFRPGTHDIEALAGDSQFGQTFDAWGHHFLVDNSHHHYHEVIAARYLERNPALPVRRATHDTPDHGTAATVYPITRNPEHQLLTDRGVFTSACGITYYLGGAFPPPYDAHVTFTAEPVHNLVHVDKVTDDGATFTASRLRANREFLASTDRWFRPVNFTIGPDGALYVVDYYRQIVEHPEWMDEETARSGSLQNGLDRGRIYRIAAEGAPPMAWHDAISLRDQETAALVDHLDNANVWWRLNAQRLLVDRQDEAAAAPLARLVRESASAEARVHALWTLDGLGRLDAALLAHALQDAAPGVRENAIRLAEARLNDAPNLAGPLLALQDDPHPKVRFQLLNTLGELDTDEARAARERLLFQDLEDEWMQVAALSAPAALPPRLFETTVAQRADRDTEGRRTYFARIGTIIGAGQDAEAVRRLVATVTDATAPGAAWWRAAALEGLAEGLRGRSGTRLGAERDAVLRLALESPDAALRRACLDVLAVAGLPSGAARRAALERAAALAADRASDAGLRADAIGLLALADPTAHAGVFEQAVDPQEPATVQTAAIGALGKIEGAAPGVFLLDRWKTLTPEVRDAAVDALMTEERAGLLLDAIEAGTVQPSVLGWQRTVVLMRDTEGALREHARRLLSEPPGTREAALERYRAALAAEGNAARGERVFTRVCAPCHQMGGSGGTAFGPDLGTVRHWSPEALLAGIVIPNASIADGYELWTVERQDGAAVQGVLSDETTTTLTLRDATGAETTLPRAAIRAMTASDVSAMPAGLETQIDARQMADLLAFLKRQR